MPDKMLPTKKPRSSNIELLRIIATFLIIACHTQHGGTDTFNFADKFSLAFAFTIRSFGQIGVSLYISSYPVISIAEASSASRMY